MAISTTVRTAGPFTGTGTISDFPFQFKVFAPHEVAAYMTNRADPPVTIQLVYDADFSVALNSDQEESPGGIFTLPDPLASGTTLLITSAMPALQPVQLTNLGGFYPAVINDALDRITICMQQLETRIAGLLPTVIQSVGFQVAETLRAATAPTTVMVAHTMGALAAGDGGGGAWIWTPEATNDDNLGTVLLPNGHIGPGRWLRDVDDSRLNARWFGCVLDGETDNTAAFQALLTLCADGGHILVEGGTLLCNTRQNVYPYGYTVLYLPTPVANLTIEIAPGATLGTTRTDARLLLMAPPGENFLTTLYPMTGDYQAGDSAITLTNAGDAEYFQAGDWIMVCMGQTLATSLAWESAYAPYAEFQRVRSVVGSVINLSAPLDKDYTPLNYPTGHALEGTAAPYGVRNFRNRTISNLRIIGGGTLSNFGANQTILAGGPFVGARIGPIAIHGGGAGLSTKFVDSTISDVEYDHTAGTLWPVCMDYGSTRNVFRNIRVSSTAQVTMHLHENCGASTIDNVSIRCLNAGSDINPNLSANNVHSITIRDVTIINDNPKGAMAKIIAPDYSAMGSSLISNAVNVIDGLHLIGSSDTHRSCLQTVCNSGKMILRAVEATQVLMTNAYGVSAMTPPHRLGPYLAAPEFHRVIPASKFFASTDDVDLVRGHYNGDISGWVFTNADGRRVACSIPAIPGARQLAFRAIIAPAVVGETTGGVAFYVTFRLEEFGAVVAGSGESHGLPMTLPANTMIQSDPYKTNALAAVSNGVLHLSVTRTASTPSDTFAGSVLFLGLEIWRNDAV